MFPRKLYPGQSYTATEQEDLARQAMRAGQVTGTGALTVAGNAANMVIRDNSDDVIYARITGAPTGSNYPWIEVAWNGSTWDDVTVWPGRSGTAAALPAVELAGRTDVPTNAIVELTPLPGGTGLGFSYGAGASSSNWSTAVAGLLTTTTQTGGGRKTSATGTGGSRGGWWVTGSSADGADPFSPYVATYTNSSPALSGTYVVQFYTSTAGEWPSPIDAAQTTVQIAGQLNAGTVSLELYSITATSPVKATKIVAAGSLHLPTPAGEDDHGFGVFRKVAGVPTLQPGIDRDFAAGERPIVRGGLVVGYV